MKGIKITVKKESDSIKLCSGDGKIEYAILMQLKNGKVIRIFVYEPICEGLLAEGTKYYDMKAAVRETAKKIRYALEPKPVSA